MPGRVLDSRISSRGQGEGRTVAVDVQYDSTHAFRVELQGVSPDEQRQLTSAFSRHAELPSMVTSAIRDHNISMGEEYMLTVPLQTLLVSEGVSASVENIEVVPWRP